MKFERQQAILQLVRTQDIFTQGELTDALAKAGFSAAQATISRDIRELRLTKEPTDDGQKYVVPEKKDESGHRMSRIFRDGLVSVDYAGNMLVLRTLSGMAMAVALAIDEMNFAEILGSVAGDDVVICVVKSEPQAAALVERLAP
ncbi:MAG: arginine repressor [Firmicutes bacterium]|nr:arginine repressor [Bacillota bacterium]